MPAARTPSETGSSRVPALRRSKIRHRRRSARRDGSAPRRAPPRGHPRQRRSPPHRLLGWRRSHVRFTRTSRWSAASGSIAANTAGASKISPWTSTTRGPCRPHSIRSMTLIPYSELGPVLHCHAEWRHAFEVPHRMHRIWPKIQAGLLCEPRSRCRCHRGGSQRGCARFCEQPNDRKVDRRVIRRESFEHLGSC